jgi:hypothetical protein
MWNTFMTKYLAYWQKNYRLFHYFIMDEAYGTERERGSLSPALQYKVVKYPKNTSSARIVFVFVWNSNYLGSILLFICSSIF